MFGIKLAEKSRSRAKSGLESGTEALKNIQAMK
jgi:hypothetical protein